MNGTVYALSEKDQVKYIGFTTSALSKRLMFIKSQKGREPMLQWMQSLGERKNSVEIFPLWFCSKEDAKAWLRLFLAYYLAQGCILLNDKLMQKERPKVGDPIADKLTYIYVLRDPKTNDVRYVGKTVDLADRKKGHKRLGKTRCDLWKKALFAVGLWPKFEVIDTVQTGENWAEREQHWIRHYRNDGCKLTNVTNGGGANNTGYVPSKETRRWFSQHFKGRPIPPEQRAKISASLTGKKQSTETVDKRKDTINANRTANGLDPWNFGKDPEIAKQKQRAYYHQRARTAGKPIRYSPEWVAKRLASFNATVAKLTPEERAKRAAHLNEKPIRYWLGKKRGSMPKEWREKIKNSMLETMRRKRQHE